MGKGKISTIVNLVANCSHCHPLSGCILSDMVGKTRQEIAGSLSVLPEAGLNRIISYCKSCPFEKKAVL